MSRQVETATPRAGKKRGKRAARRANASLTSGTVNSDAVIDGIGIAVTIGGVVTALGMLPSQHPSLVEPWLLLLDRFFGMLAFAVPLAMMGIGVWLVARRFADAPSPPRYRILGLLLLAAAILGVLALIEQWHGGNGASNSAGLLGFYIARLVTLAVGHIAALAVLLWVGMLGALFLFELSLTQVVRFLARLAPRMRSAQEIQVEGDRDERHGAQLSLLPAEQVVGATRSIVERWLGARTQQATPPSHAPEALVRSTEAEALPVKNDGDTAWWLPSWERLLEDAVILGDDMTEVRSKSEIIETTLAHFGVPARVVEVNRGPTVTQYGVEPGFVRKMLRGKERDLKVKVSAITSLQNDLALALAAPRIRIEAPVPGHSFVGIEVPNDTTNVVTLRGIMESREFQELRAPLRVALGRDVRGNPVVADLAKMPHLLIAGATGSGKSVCINTIICSLLCNNTPDTLKLLLVDPKMVELTGYNSVPHLIVPVVTELERVVGLLRWSVSEMERRYKLFSDRQVRNLASYNARATKQGDKTLPHLVLVIDELADLMMAAADQVESMICRLAQMARATGIHLILATQRPSVDVVTGLIKANVPARIAFAVASQVDSRVILDRPGAEALLGQGDMLYMASDSGTLRRAQGCFVSDRELERINRFWREQAADATKASTPREEPGRETNPVPPVQPVLWDELLDETSEEEDELLPEARELIRKSGTASISLLQRRLRVGYARAASLIDLLEAEGTIGTSEGPGKTREVFMDEGDLYSE